MALPPLRAIQAGKAQLSSTHLQGPGENDAAAALAEFFPEQQPLRHIGATSNHRLPKIEPGQALELVNTEVTRTAPDTVSLSRATSTTYDPDAVTVEGPASFSAEQMTPRARTFLLPPLEELSHAAYLRRAGGSEDRLSEEHWERSLEQLQNGYDVADIAEALHVDAGQVAIVHTQLRETDPESIAATPSTRSASPSVDAGITTPGGTFVSDAELDRVRGLQAQNPATRNADGTPTDFGAAIGKRGTRVKDGTSVLNHVGRALAQKMVQDERPQREVSTALGISSGVVAALKREVEGRADTSGAPAPDEPGVTTPRGTFVPDAELARVRGLQAQNPATRNADGTPTDFGAAIGKRGTRASDRTSALNHVGRALAQKMVEDERPQREIRTALGIDAGAAATLKREIEARADASNAPAPDEPGVTTPRGTFVSDAELARVRALQAQNPATRNADGTPTDFGTAIGKRGITASDRTSVLNHVGRALGQQMIQNARSQGELSTALGIGKGAAAALKREVKGRGDASGAPAPDESGVTTPLGTFVSDAEFVRVRALQAQNPATRNADGTPTDFGAAIGKRGTSASDSNSVLNHVGRALGQQMIQNARSQGELSTALGIGTSSAAALKREVQARAVADANKQSPVSQAESSKRGAARLDDRDRSRSEGR